MTIELDHDWAAPPVIAPNIYPVDWRVDDRRALNVYERAKDQTWNPARLAWDGVDAGGLDPEERLAVAYHGALGAMFEYAAAPQFLHPLPTLYERHEEHGLILLCMATGRDEFVHEEFFRRVANAMIPGFPFEFTPRTELEHRAVQNLRWVEWKQSRMWPTYTEKVVLGDNPWLLQISILAPEIVGMVLFDRIVHGVEWPALQEGYRNVDLDERRHVAYGRLLFEKRMRDRDRPRWAPTSAGSWPSSPATASSTPWACSPCPSWSPATSPTSGCARPTGHPGTSPRPTAACWAGRCR